MKQKTVEFWSHARPHGTLEHYIMRLVDLLPRKLLHLSKQMQVSLVVCCYLLCLVIFVLLTSYNQQNAVVFGIPIALATWLFKQKGAAISIGCTLCVLCIYAAIPGNEHLSFFFNIFINALSLIVDALIILYLRYAVDVADTASKQAQQARQQMTLAYEQQRQAYEQQLHLNQMKDQFLLNVNHELRTPLTELYGYLELLQVYHDQIDETMQDTFLSRAVQGCEELQRLITHIMDAIQAGTNVKPPVIEEVALAEVVGDLLDRLDPRKHQEYQIHLEIPQDLTVWADPMYLRQILRNLLSNAFKYSPAHSVIVINAEIHEETIQGRDHPYTNPFVCISVQDTGPGIPSKELPLLLGKFVRLQRDISGSVRGTGLGLYICKQLVDAMDGHIWAESSGIPGQGSRFCFTLPQSTGNMVATPAIGTVAGEKNV